MMQSVLRLFVVLLPMVFVSQEALSSSFMKCKRFGDLDSFEIDGKDNNFWFPEIINILLQGGPKSSKHKSLSADSITYQNGIPVSLFISTTSHYERSGQNLYIEFVGKRKHKHLKLTIYEDVVYRLDKKKNGSADLDFEHYGAGISRSVKYACGRISG